MFGVFQAGDNETWKNFWVWDVSGRRNLKIKNYEAGIKVRSDNEEETNEKHTRTEMPATENVPDAKQRRKVRAV